MSQRDIDSLSKNVIEVRAESLVLQSLCAMLVVELVLLKSPDRPRAELDEVVKRFSGLAEALGRQSSGMGRITVPIATEITSRVRVIAETALKNIPEHAG